MIFFIEFVFFNLIGLFHELDTVQKLKRNILEPQNFGNVRSNWRYCICAFRCLARNVYFLNGNEKYEIY